MRNDNSQPGRLRPPSGGFVVIELGTATGIIGVLIALLFPQLQTVRERTNRSRAEADMKQICATSAGLAANRTITMNGYTMFLPDGSPARMIAEPLAGRTGGETVTVDTAVGCPMTISPTPGADRALRLGLEDVMISGYSLVARLTDGTSNTLMVGFASQPIQPLLDLLAGPDGRFSFLTVQQAMERLSRESSDPNLAAALNGFVRQAFAILQLGANNEQWTTFPSTAIDTKAITVKDLLSLDTLAALTTDCADRADVVPELLALIQVAKTNPGVLDTYIARVVTAASPSVPGGAASTVQEAQALTAMARLLR